MGACVDSEHKAAEPVTKHEVIRVELVNSPPKVTKQTKVEQVKTKGLEPTEEFRLIQKKKPTVEPQQMETPPKLSTKKEPAKEETMVEEKAPVMMNIGRKKKNRESEFNKIAEEYPTKFQFKDNFQHLPKVEEKEQYQYEPYDFGPITISPEASNLYPWVVLETGISYRELKGGTHPRRRPQKYITSKDASELKRVVFQSQTANFPKSWSQGFIFSPHEQTPFGLRQIEGGPCGIIAAVQCYYLKHLLLTSGQKQFTSPVLRENCLVAAMTDLLWKVKSTDRVVLAFPPRGATKLDVFNLRTVTIETTQFKTLFGAVMANKDQFIGVGNFGVASLMLSTVLTRTPEKIFSEMDTKQCPLIGNHGHCTQELVNMFLTGRASSNCFDGDRTVDDYTLRGVIDRVEFGFLTVFEVLKFIEVGKNLKEPVLPIWVVCKQFHYHVVFGPHYMMTEKETPKFDLVYFDGLYNCGDRIRLTLSTLPSSKETLSKDLPLIQQVLATNWGLRSVNWNGRTPIL